MSMLDAVRRIQKNEVDLTKLPEVPLVQRARVYNSADIALTTGAATALTFNSERYDVGLLHSTSVNTGRITILVAGVYDIGGCIRFESNATGVRDLYVRLNGTTTLVADRRNAVNGEETIISVNGAYALAAGDYVELIARQTSGGNLNVTATGNYSPEFWINRT